VFRFKAVFVPTTPLEILILITVGLYVVGQWQERSFSPVRIGLEIPTALLLFAGLIGIVVSPDHVGAIGFYRAYFIEPIFLFYVAVGVLRKPADFRTVITGFAIGTTVFAILNLGAWAIALANHKDIDLGNAPEALYTSPNSVAIFLEPAVAMAAGFALYSDNRRDRIASLVWLACVLLSLIATLSRGGLLTLAVLALVAVVTLPRPRLRLGLLLAIVVGGIGLLQVPFVSKRLYRQFDPSYPYNTFEGRLEIWKDTFHMLRDHPIFGTGLRGYSIVMRPYVTTPTKLPELYPHNIFLAMWVELGLLGLVAFVWLLGKLLWLGWSAYSKAQGLAKPLLFGTSAAFVAVAVHGMFDTPYYNNDISVEFWFLAALEIAAITILVRPATGKEALLR
jgi:O-antigen ligase